MSREYYFTSSGDTKLAFPAPQAYLTPTMDNESSDEITKVPLHMPKLDWAADRQGALMSLFNASGAGGGQSASRPTIITSGSTGYDGTSDPGAPGEPV